VDSTLPGYISGVAEEMSKQAVEFSHMHALGQIGKFPESVAKTPTQRKQADAAMAARETFRRMPLAPTESSLRATATN
jgi:hypothetical protein